MYKKVMLIIYLITGVLLVGCSKVDSIENTAIAYSNCYIGVYSNSDDLEGLQAQYGEKISKEAYVYISGLKDKLKARESEFVNISLLYDDYITNKNIADTVNLELPDDPRIVFKDDVAYMSLAELNKKHNYEEVVNYNGVMMHINMQDINLLTYDRIITNPMFSFKYETSMVDIKKGSGFVDVMYSSSYNTDKKVIRVVIEDNTITSIKEK